MDLMLLEPYTVLPLEARSRTRREQQPTSHSSVGIVESNLFVVFRTSARAVQLQRARELSTGAVVLENSFCARRSEEYQLGFPS